MIQQVARGVSHTPMIGPNHIPDQTHHPLADTHSLTARHLQILQLFAEGHSLKEVDAILCISQKTVEFHRARLLERLRLKTTAQLIRFAVEQGIVAKLAAESLR